MLFLSFLLLPFLLLLFQLYLMNLNHSVLVLLIVVGSNRPRWSNQVHNIVVLVHLSPMSSIEPVGISQIDISALSQQQFDDFLETKSSRIVQSCQSSLIPQSSIGSTVQ